MGTESGAQKTCCQGGCRVLQFAPMHFAIICAASTRPFAAKGHHAVMGLSECTQRLPPPPTSRRTCDILMGRKPGVAEPAELEQFIANAGSAIIVVDARSTDFDVEPGDKATHAYAPIGSKQQGRLRCINAPYDRKAGLLDLALIPQDWIESGGGRADVPIITHCGGGGRGEKAKQYLMSQGFNNVINGGGPEDAECWVVF